MNIIESNGLSYNGIFTEELLNAVKLAKDMTKDYTVATDGRRNYECNLEIIYGNNLNNSQILLTTKRLGETFAYYSGGVFWGAFGYRGTKIQFVR